MILPICIQCLKTEVNRSDFRIFTLFFSISSLPVWPVRPFGQAQGPLRWDLAGCGLVPEREDASTGSFGGLKETQHAAWLFTQRLTDLNLFFAVGGLVSHYNNKHAKRIDPLFLRTEHETNIVHDPAADYGRVPQSPNFFHGLSPFVVKIVIERPKRFCFLEVMEGDFFRISFGRTECIWMPSLRIFYCTHFVLQLHGAVYVFLVFKQILAEQLFVGANTMYEKGPEHTYQWSLCW